MRAPTPLLERLRAIAAAAPTHPAIDVPSRGDRARRVLSYGDLLRRVDELAAGLTQSIGAASGDDEPIVVLALPREDPDLYAAQLAAWRIGAAFTCIDPAFPLGHVAEVIADARPVAIVADAAQSARLATLAGSTPIVATDRAASAAPLPPARDDPRRLAYLIYTSGSTGRPKGVLIEQGSIAHLVATDVDRFRLGLDDRVAQCSSAAYDSSLEETWLAFAVGATLVPLDDETVRLGPDLVPWLAREGITVLCPPPTLLRATACREPWRELPALRLLYVGGEALPQDLADRWSLGRRMENGYGPTECTVTVVRGPVEPGRPVSIGRAVEGSVAHVLDEALEPVAEGEVGELCIAGPQLARGYRGLPALTAERFPEHPRFGRLYRTGDLVRRRCDGDLEYLGRCDAQVKLRGHRIELEAVEAALAEDPSVFEAACRVESSDGRATLVAFVVPTDPDRPPDPVALRDRVRQRLPAAAVPGRIASIERLPRTIGGKLDRRSLPALAAEVAVAAVVPDGGLEARVAIAFAAATRHAGAVDSDADFFEDLGGDSLAAVDALLRLRDDPATTAATVRDIYLHRTPRALAAALRDASGRRTTVESSRSSGARGSVVRSAVAQSAWILCEVWVLGAAAAAIAILGPERLVGALGARGAAYAAPPLAAALLAAAVPASVLVAASVKRVAVGRIAEGRVEAWTARWVRHWIARQAARLVPWGLLAETEFASMALRMLGARVGRRVHVARGVVIDDGWDLLAIGDDAALRRDAMVVPAALRAGGVEFAPIAIGARAIVGVRATVAPGASIGADAEVEPLASIEGGFALPDGERWGGVPAARRGDARSSPLRGDALSPLLHATLLLATRLGGPAALALALVATVDLVGALVGGDPFGACAAWLERPVVTIEGLATAALVLVVATPLALVASALALRAAGRVPSGEVPLRSLAALRISWKSAALDAAGAQLSGTLLWPLWLRLAGMRVGRGCEISTIIDVVPETIAIGAESFFADGIYLGSPEVGRGAVRIAMTELGRDTFLGNHAVVPAGARLPQGLFLGVATIAPDRLDRSDAGSGWFGQPPMRLPRREVVALDRALTHEPSLPRRVQRLAWECARFLLPMPILLVGAGWFAMVAEAAERDPLAAALLVGPLATLAAGASLVALVVALKWTLLGRVRPGQHGLWSSWCSRWDFLFVAWGLWGRGTLARLDGTPWLAMVLRATGMRIGRRVLLGRGFTQVVDPDMLAFGDEATVACQFQAHTFEDRVLKLDRVRIGAGATAGENAVLLYGADVGDGAEVAPGSVVMKRQRLEGGRRHAGAPVA